MGSRLADARAALHTALTPVLPGRVDPYPPAAGRVAAPKVWIGDVDTTPATIGSNTTVTLAQFPVVIVYDGAAHAQVAGLDDLLSAVLDAVAAAAGFESDGSRVGPVVELPVDSTLRAVTVTATATITARTLCPPAPTTATVPPTPLEATHV
jgi:hypothetical protein